MNNPTHPLKKIKFGIIPIASYLGVLVTKTKTGYTVLNQQCNNEEEVDEVITEAGSRLSKSIVNEEVLVVLMIKKKHYEPTYQF